MAAPVTRNLTILLTDIKGFTDKTSQKSRTQIQEMLESHKAIVLPILESRGGKLVKTIGDAFLMVFESPTDAVLAGVAVQDALDKHNEGKAHEDRIEVRIAINAGEVNLADNDIFGEPVNITARIEGVAEAGEVFFTEAVYLAMNKTEVPSSTVGQLQLKGIPEKVRVYKVKRERPIGDTVDGGGAASVAGARTIWDRLKTASPAASPAGSSEGLPDLPSERAPKAVMAPTTQTRGVPPKLSRRAVALAIDGALVAMLVGILSPGEKSDFRVKVGGDKKAISSMRKALKQGIKDGTIKMDETGIHGTVGDKKVSINNDGIAIGPGGAPSVETSEEPADTLLRRKVTVNAKEQRLSKLAREMSEQTKVNFVLDEGVEDVEVTMFLQSATLQEALDVLRDTKHLSYRKIGDSTYKIDYSGSAADEVILDKDGVRVTRRHAKRNLWFPLFWIVYNTLFITVFASTPGKKAMKLRVVSDAAMDSKRSFARALSSLLSGYILFLGYLWAIWDKERRTWHDHIVGTRVESCE
ncbi:MAG: RDD family protein [Elusimicrobia bacterium]|nr:RDD family protein [Elusimicrobiota bacterium]